MKRNLFILAVLLVLAAFSVTGAGAVASMGTTFTYQGSLILHGAPVTGNCDFQFSLWKAKTGGTQQGSTQTVTSVRVTNGWYTVQLNGSNQFGSNAFNGEARWLGIAVRCPAGSGSYTALAPRVTLAAAPYALYSTNANLLDGQHASAFSHTSVGENSFVGGGSDNLASGNLSTVGGGRYNTASGGPSFVGGGWGNTANGESCTVGGGSGNTASSYYSTVGGGANNTASGDYYSTIGGGFSNTASNNRSTVGGGENNNASANASTIGGGLVNTAGGIYSIVGGGYDNKASSPSSTVGGGSDNQALGSYSTVPGGSSNVASADYTFAAGRLAYAMYEGSFVWADSNNFAFQSSAVNQFAVRAFGGVLFSTGPGPFTINGNRVWHEGNDGPDSGLNADLLDGQHASAFNHVSIGSDSFVGGGISNTASGSNAVIGGGKNNQADGRSATVGGGESNITSNDYTTVGGGKDNNANSYASTIGGGDSNSASGGTSTVGGGTGNNASGSLSTVGGGNGNLASGEASTIGGGFNNTAGGDYSTVPGGNYNIASANFTFAVGRYANAMYEGSFVWADSHTFGFPSTASNEFSARATGGVRFVSAIDGDGNPTAGVSLASGGGSWSSLSDRNLKANFAAVNSNDILDAIATLPISTWNYKAQDQSIRHIGPTAQDFYAAFGVGEDSTHITSVDADGVALAAIQALSQLNRQLEARVAALEGEKGGIQAGTSASPWMYATLVLLGVVIGLFLPRRKISWKRNAAR